MSRVYTEEQKKRRIGYFLKWKLANPEYWKRPKKPDQIKRIREYNQKWYREHPQYYANKRLKNREGSRNACRLWRSKNPEKCRHLQTRWKRKNRPKIRLYRRKISENLTDGYVASQLKISVKLCPPQLIAAKRAHIQLRRFIKENKT